MLTRRKTLQVAGGVLAAPFLPSVGWAQTYPTRPITIVVPFPAGGATDIVGRTLADRMRQSLGQTVIVENVSGAGGSIAVRRAARANPDGYTLSLGNSATHVINGATMNLDFDAVKDFEPVALLTETPMWIVARNSLPAGNATELIAWLKANPGKATVGVVGVGSLGEVIGVYFQKMTGTTFQFVPYRGFGQISPDLISGQIDLTITQAANTIEQVRGKQIKALVVMAKSRWSPAPDVATSDEGGAPGLYAPLWHGVWVQKGTPQAIITRLNASIRDALAEPAVQQRFADLGQEIFPRDQQTPAALGALQRAEVDKWWPIIKAANIKGE